jgi:chromate transporter
VTSLLLLCVVCLRVGALVFGGGFVMIPLLQADVVDHYHWLNQQQFVDAVALGQMTPGPLLVTATFVGYKVGAEQWGPAGGVLGGTLATACMFLPSFLMVLLVARNLKRVQSNPHVQNFLWGVRAAVVGLIVAAAWPIAQHGCAEVGPAALGVLALVVLMWKNVDAGLTIIVSGLAGLVLWAR